MELIIATHIVKPSSPTPVRFKSHKLSFVDQISASIYTPLIFFYEHDKSKHHEQIPQRLRQSLSEILTVFYPLAGTVKENLFVDCDDSGVDFVEARVHGRRLVPLIQNPNMEELNQLVPVVDSLSHNDSTLLSVKTSCFDCGGISVGVCLSHKIGDMASFVMFMNAWASTCRGESSRIIPPSFDLGLQFPPTDSSVSEIDVGVGKEKIVTKRLVFDSKMIDKLRQEAAASVKNPSRVEAVTAFIWRNLIDANKAVLPASGTSSLFVAGHAVNMRPRTLPPIPDNSFGNCSILLASAVLSPEEVEDEVQHVVKLREALRAVDDDYIKTFITKAQNEGFHLFEPVNSFRFSSWLRFPVYDVDFGWGKPVWVGTATIPQPNLVFLMSTPSGDGMEAWVNINPDEDFFHLLQVNYSNLLMT